MATTDARGRAVNSAVYGSAGTVVEWFDYGLYLYLVPVMGPLFFPSDDPVVSSIGSFGVFVVGSLARIAGGAFYGKIGDRDGRKRALTLSVLLMLVPMGLTAALPTYAEVGILAPLLLVAIRVVQGFSAGGEYSGTIVLLVEQAPPGRRGFLAAGAILTSGIGILAASLTVSALTSTMTDSAMSSYGWRIAYVVGACVALWALAMRRRMQETDAFDSVHEAHRAEHPVTVRDTLRRQPRAVLVAALLSGYGGIVYFVVLGYLPSYLDGIGAISREAVTWITTAMTIGYAVGTPALGALSDRWGRRPVMAAAAGILVLGSVPLFVLLGDASVGWVLLAELALLVPLMAYTGPMVAAAAELFSTRDRYTALAVGYDLGTAVLGSTAPLIGATLVSVTGADLAPSFYLVAMSIAIIPVLIAMRETARISLGEVDRTAEMLAVDLDGSGDGR